MAQLTSTRIKVARPPHTPRNSGMISGAITKPVPDWD